MMPQGIQPGAVVKFHYTLSIDGTVVDSSLGREPLTYIHGTGQIVSGLEAGLEGLNQGSQRHIHLPPERGYGDRNPEAVQRIPREVFVGAEDLVVGAVVSGRSGGIPFQAVVSEIAADYVTLDLNLPLAGKTLDFDVEIIEVRDQKN